MDLNFDELKIVNQIFSGFGDILQTVSLTLGKLTRGNAKTCNDNIICEEPICEYFTNRAIVTDGI